MSGGLVLYADRRARRTRQIVFDVVVAGWLLLWWWVAVRVRHQTDGSRANALGLSKNADGMATQLRDAGARLRKVPLVGDTLDTPFVKASGQAHGMALSAQDLAGGVDRLGLLLGVLVPAVPMTVAVLVWCYLRLRYARAAGAARTLSRRDGGRELLALRALHSAAPERLLALGPDLTERWRAGDADTVGALADLELARHDLSPKRH
ncbi:hypothetical protein G9U51_14620 [Calidifontibacter sp. DB0510]|uniref:Transmembrane protein n=1 Tax=Metallococcus carri TaxID=1656884 RepID=A0A967EA20_9MICO|nr:hypothetical protein [Metallococcus carri]NHN57002.1 hypothetical protein [Metallococcus carri]NOP37747.1 hypothetical protein [Calidifontibacter sp. DB2511S]